VISRLCWRALLFECLQFAEEAISFDVLKLGLASAVGTTRRTSSELNLWPVSRRRLVRIVSAMSTTEVTLPAAAAAPRAVSARITYLVLNDSRAGIVCRDCAVAETMRSRMRGLLGRGPLQSYEGLLLRPAPSIHTFFMRFPIDVLFLDSDMRVVGIHPAVPPWRAKSSRRARAVLELAAGSVERCNVRIGDRLALRAADEGGFGGV
jgi:uncharacterized membrane protein (UPF0127 family)